MTKKRLIIKSLAIFLSLSLVLTQGLWAYPDSYSVTVPEEQGVITHRFKGSDQRLIIHIQDAHTSFEAQENLANIICELLPQIESADSGQLTAVSRVPFIGIEGALDEYDLEMLRRFPFKNIKERIGRELTQRGDIVGTELAAILSEQPFSIVGLEDDGLFQDSYARFISIQKKMSLVHEICDELNANLDEMKKTFFTAEMYQFSEMLNEQTANAQTISALLLDAYGLANNYAVDVYQYPYLQRTLEILSAQQIQRGQLEAEIKHLLANTGQQSSVPSDINQLCDNLQSEEVSVEKLFDMFPLNVNAAFNAEQFPALCALHKKEQFMHSLNGEQLLKDINAMGSDILARMAPEESIVRLIELDEKARLFERVLTLHATPEDAARFIASEEEYSISSLLQCMNDIRVSHGMPSIARSMNETIIEAQQDAAIFYKIAVQRDTALLENLIKHMNSKHQSVGVLVSGGFHTPGVVAALKDKGVSFVVVKPRLNAIHADLNDAYIHRLMNKDSIAPLPSAPSYAASYFNSVLKLAAGDEFFMNLLRRAKITMHAQSVLEHADYGILSHENLDVVIECLKATGDLYCIAFAYAIEDALMSHHLAPAGKEATTSFGQELVDQTNWHLFLLSRHSDKLLMNHDEDTMLDSNGELIEYNNGTITHSLVINRAKNRDIDFSVFLKDATAREELIDELKYHILFNLGQSKKIRKEEELINPKLTIASDGSLQIEYTSSLRTITALLTKEGQLVVSMEIEWDKLVEDSDEFMEVASTLMASAQENIYYAYKNLKRLISRSNSEQRKVEYPFFARRLSTHIAGVLVDWMNQGARKAMRSYEISGENIFHEPDLRLFQYQGDVINVEDNVQFVQVAIPEARVRIPKECYSPESGQLDTNLMHYALVRVYHPHLGWVKTVLPIYIDRDILGPDRGISYHVLIPSFQGYAVIEELFSFTADRTHEGDVTSHAWELIDSDGIEIKKQGFDIPDVIETEQAEQTDYSRWPIVAAPMTRGLSLAGRAKVLDMGISSGGTEMVRVGNCFFPSDVPLLTQYGTWAWYDGWHRLQRLERANDAVLQVVGPHPFVGLFEDDELVEQVEHQFEDDQAIINTFVRMAMIAHKLGYKTLDINMCSPARVLALVHGGAAMLRKPDLACAIIRAIREHVPDLNVSTKILLLSKTGIVKKDELREIVGDTAIEQLWDILVTGNIITIEAPRRPGEGIIAQKMIDETDRELFIDKLVDAVPEIADCSDVVYEYLKQARTRRNDIVDVEETKDAINAMAQAGLSRVTIQAQTPSFGRFHIDVVKEIARDSLIPITYNGGILTLTEKALADIADVLHDQAYSVEWLQNYFAGTNVDNYMLGRSFLGPAGLLNGKIPSDQEILEESLNYARLLADEYAGMGKAGLTYVQLTLLYHIRYLSPLYEKVLRNAVLQATSTPQIVDCLERALLSVTLEKDVPSEVLYSTQVVGEIQAFARDNKRNVVIYDDQNAQHAFTKEEVARITAAVERYEAMVNIVHDGARASFTLMPLSQFKREGASLDALSYDSVIYFNGEGAFPGIMQKQADIGVSFGALSTKDKPTVRTLRVEHVFDILTDIISVLVSEERKSGHCIIFNAALSRGILPHLDALFETKEGKAITTQYLLFQEISRAA